jgi:selenocysteine lyase/cysteine desulfurase
MSPLMKSVVDAGVYGIKRKLHPWAIHSEDFFNQAEVVKERFGQLIHAPSQQVAIIPSASYGLKTAVSNIPGNAGSHVIMVSNDFPSDYYTVQDWCRANNKNIKVISPPEMWNGRGKAWNDSILEAITPETSAVVMSSIHWTDGTKFNLKQIGEKCKSMNARFIVDGTQSVGALSIDVMDMHIDALICAAYKWLLGPYSIGLAYYSEVYNNGVPIENSWMNRSNAKDFTNLTRYVDQYNDGAARYNVGEFSNYILLPMLDIALQQLNAWEIDPIQTYCGKLIEPLLFYLQENGFWFEDNAYRANHLFGFMLPARVDKGRLLRELLEQKVFVSVRGDGIRVSTHVYNDEKDVEALVQTLKHNL